MLRLVISIFCYFIDTIFYDYERQRRLYGTRSSEEGDIAIGESLHAINESSEREKIHRVSHHDSPISRVRVSY